MLSYHNIYWKRCMGLQYAAIINSVFNICDVLLTSCDTAVEQNKNVKRCREAPNAT